MTPRLCNEMMPWCKCCCLAGNMRKHAAVRNPDRVNVASTASATELSAALFRHSKSNTTCNTCQCSISKSNALSIGGLRAGSPSAQSRHIENLQLAVKGSLCLWYAVPLLRKRLDCDKSPVFARYDKGNRPDKMNLAMRLTGSYHLHYSKSTELPLKGGYHLNYKNSTELPIFAP